MDCINQAWDEEAQRGIYSCPECRQTFAYRPVISKNVMLTDVIKMLNQSGVKDTPTTSTPRRNLKCFDCTGSEPTATVSCLACRRSFCESHYALHEIQHLRHDHREQPVRSKDQIDNDVYDNDCFVMVIDTLLLKKMKKKYIVNPTFLIEVCQLSENCSLKLTTYFCMDTLKILVFYWLYCM